MIKNEPDQKNSTQKRLVSFRYAFNGIWYLFKTQPNARIHLLAAVVVIALGFCLSVSQTEWLILVITMGSVIAAETVNTSIELLVDKISPGYDPVAGRIKDLGAASVLFTAIAAAVVGIVIFGPRLWGLW
nr:diacylglycerol kinase family protein [Bacteroidota bacterium]